MGEFQIMSVMSGALDQVRDFVMTCGQSMGISYYYQHVYHPYHFEGIINNQRLHHYHQHCLNHHPLHQNFHRQHPLQQTQNIAKHLRSNNFVIIREMNICTKDLDILQQH